MLWSKLVVQRRWLLSLAFLSTVAFLLSGCAHWSKEQVAEKPTILTPPVPAPDTVVIEAVLIRFPEESAPELERIWQVVDESVIDVQVRRELHANGMQCGMLVGDMPLVVRSRLKELNTNDAANSLERMGLAAEVSSDTQRLHCHTGHRKELSLRQGLSETVTVLHVHDGNIQGNTYQHPRILLDIRTTPLGDGRAKLKLCPEIQHGIPQEVFMANQVAQQMRVDRKQQRWEYLTMETTIAPGQFFFCTLTNPPRGLGQAFFSTRTSERTTERVLLVMRMLPGQVDELFAPAH